MDRRFIKILSLTKTLALVFVLGCMLGHFDNTQAQDSRIPSFTLDFEEGTLRGWESSGRAFINQPASVNNLSLRNRDELRRWQGNFWVSSSGDRQNIENQRQRAIQGNTLTGSLISSLFVIPEGSLSFLISGSSNFNTRVELNIIDQIEGRIRVEYATGNGNETIERVEWDLSQYAGRTGELRIIDEMTNGHIGVDDFIFSHFQNTFRIQDRPYATINPTIADQRVFQVQPTVGLEASNNVIETGINVQFGAALNPQYRNPRYNFHFGNDDQSGWQESPRINYIYDRAGRYEVFVEVIPEPDRNTIIRSEPVEIEVLNPEINLFLDANKTDVFVNEPIQIRGGSDNEAVSLIIYYGDDNVGNFEGPMVEYSYSLPGTYRVQLVAFLEQQALDSRSITIIVGNPDMTLNASDTFAEIGNTILFDIEIDPFRPDFMYEIDFGNNIRTTFGFNESVDHRYFRPGVYVVSASARNPEGDMIIRSNPIEMRVISVGLTSNRYELGEGESTRFTASIEPELDASTYYFNIGDTTITTTNPELEYIFQEAGEYGLSLTALIEGRRFSSDSYTISVRPNNQVNLIANTSEAKAGDVIEFTAVGLFPNLSAEYNFYFGDGEESGWTKNPKVVHAYRDNGPYSAFVEARFSDDRFVQSRPLTIVVSGFPFWILTVAGILVLFTGGYLLSARRISKNNRKKSPSTDYGTIHVNPKLDNGKQNIVQNNRFDIKTEIKLKPVKDIGHQIINSTENILIKERSYDDESSQ